MKFDIIRIAFPVFLVAIAGIGCNKSDNKIVSCYTMMIDKKTVPGPDHQIETLIYNNNKLISRIVEKIGGGNSIIIYSFDSKGNIIKAASEPYTFISYTYDANNKLTGQDAKGLSMYQNYTYDYNSSGQLITSTETFYWDGPPFSRVTHYQYPDLSSRNPSSSTIGGDPPEYTTVFEYDNNPNPDRQFFSIHSTRQ